MCGFGKWGNLHEIGGEILYLNKDISLEKDFNKYY